MVTKKLMYFTEDGKMFETERDAEKHQKSYEVMSEIEHLVFGKDLLRSKSDTILNFIEDNLEELNLIFSKLSV